MGARAREERMRLKRLRHLEVIQKERSCSFCGVVGSTSVTCPKCLFSRYCTVQCYEKDTEAHAKTCVESCLCCGSTGVELWYCATCCRVRYCGEECKDRHLKTHLKTCVSPRQLEEGQRREREARKRRADEAVLMK